MQALKALVGGMGILIIVIMTVIAYGLYRKASDPGFKFFALSEQKGDPAPAAFGNVELSLPPGCSIANVGGDGSRLTHLATPLARWADRTSLWP